VVFIYAPAKFGLVYNNAGVMHSKYLLGNKEKSNGPSSFYLGEITKGEGQERGCGAKNSRGNVQIS